VEQVQLVSPNFSCRNRNCLEYGKRKPDNIRKFGRTRKGTQRYQCKTCKRTFVETRGTVFYGRHHSQETILECLALLAERNSLAAIHRDKGIKEETVMEWLREAAKHGEQIETLLLTHHCLTRAQLDVLWRLADRGRYPDGLWEPSGRPRAVTSTHGLRGAPSPSAT
jgi:transposase-like protein